MRFNQRSFEQRYRAFLEDSLRPKLIAPALALTAYSLYSLFAGDWFTSEQYIKQWDSPAIVIYNMTWLSFLVMGAFAVYVGLQPAVFRNSVETFFQYWALYVLIVGVLFGNRWRVVNICDVPYGQVFTTGSDKYPEIDLVMLLVGIVIYLAIYAEMRLRRMVWVMSLSLLVYSVTAIVFGIPLPQTITDSSGNTTVYEISIDRSQAWFLSISLLLLFAVALLGKFTLELLQRQNFLQLELAQKRIDVLEKTINAIDDDNQPHTQLEQTHKRLKDAERIIEKVRLMGLTTAKNAENDGSQLAFAQELETALTLIRKTERNMTMLDFQKEVLLGPIRTGIEYKQEEVIHWLESVVNPIKAANRAHPRSTQHTGGPPSKRAPSEASYAKYGYTIRSPRRASTSSGSRGITEDDLGISARSLMKQIGVDWTLSLPDLERTLHENQATDLSAIRLVARATIGSVSREFLNVNPEIVFSFAKALEEMYLDVPFHNAHHAAQVCHHVNVLVELTGVRKVLSRVDQIALSVAGLCHDVSHFGRSNAYLVETHHELAIRYNDSSVLENFHAAMTFQLIKSSSAKDITAGLSKRDERRFRARVIQLILATDTVSHFQLVGELRMRLINKSLFEDPQLEETDRRVVLSSLMRAADLGYQAMPLETHTGWVEKLAEEYAQQGDDERALGLAISPMCDRSSQDIPSMQIGFMNLVVMPLFDEIFILVKNHNPSRLDDFSAVCGLLVDNHTHWNMERNMRASLRGENLLADDQRTLNDDRMSDGSELYIPAPNDISKPNIAHPFDHEDSSPRSHPDLIQRVYSNELKRSNSGSMKAPAQEPRSYSESSVVSLTYSQAHGHLSDSESDQV